ncbi:unnamed protein product [Fusarium graminearum]|uniref:Chromosome 3, complete genome n=1 Tax=Gibberella zeae (strain ATCC MYA-4620 / CBS 123657 / FGSC 9075 / NRRL 31084 / PH-1) TaxID=229533 RepID=A0A098E3E1_GIBZE|nr:unnamed protein product [Fusarium graminearum]CZS85456.1 unnamed protein product [Fusarium graminearum]
MRGLCPLISFTGDLGLDLGLGAWGYLPTDLALAPSTPKSPHRPVRYLLHPLELGTDRGAPEPTKES